MYDEMSNSDKTVPVTPAGSKLSRETAKKAMMDVGYLDFEADLVCNISHYIDCIPGLVRMGSPHRDAILKPAGDLMAAISSIVTSRRLQAKIEEIRSQEQDQDSPES